MYHLIATDTLANGTYQDKRLLARILLGHWTFNIHNTCVSKDIQTLYLSDSLIIWGDAETMSIHHALVRSFNETVKNNLTTQEQKILNYRIESEKAWGDNYAFLLEEYMTADGDANYAEESNSDANYGYERIKKYMKAVRIPIGEFQFFDVLYLSQEYFLTAGITSNSSIADNYKGENDPCMNIVYDANIQDKYYSKKTVDENDWDGYKCKCYRLGSQEGIDCSLIPENNFDSDLQQ